MLLPSGANSSVLSRTSTMTLSEGEKSLSVSLDAFHPSWRATQRVLALGGRGGDGEKVEGQRSTTAKRQTGWPGRLLGTSPGCQGPPSALHVQLHARCSSAQPKTTGEVT